jgi:acyl carrier protein
MTQDVDELVDRVLSCANRVAGTALRVSDDDDVALEVFGFDSLSAFAFMIELEETCGLVFDESLLEPGRLVSIRSVAALIASKRAKAE